MEAIVQVMESAMGARDPYTVEHQQRVARLACTLAEEMGLSSERIQALHTAATLHDLGKIAIPSGILAKPGKLTDFEFAMIKPHPQIGYDILKPLKFPGQIGQTILQHHERMNGSGYPQGIKGKHILQEARILGVADVLDAMCFHRPYRSALGLDQAAKEISQGKGVLYDTAVVETCLRLCDQCQVADHLFMDPNLERHDQMLSSDSLVTEKDEENLVKGQPLVGDSRFTFPGLRTNQVRFILQSAAASILGAIIMLGNKGI